MLPSASRGKQAAERRSVQTSRIFIAAIALWVVAMPAAIKARRVG